MVLEGVAARLRARRCRFCVVEPAKKLAQAAITRNTAAAAAAATTTALTATASRGEGGELRSGEWHWRPWHGGLCGRSRGERIRLRERCSKSSRRGRGRTRLRNGGARGGRCGCHQHLLQLCTAAATKTTRHCRLRRHPRRGVRGLRVARGVLLLFLLQDATPAGFFAICRRRLQRRPRQPSVSVRVSRRLRLGSATRRSRRRRRHRGSGVDGVTQR